MNTLLHIKNIGRDFYKLKMLKLGIISVDGKSLIIALQIADSCIETDLASFIPAPYANCIKMVPTWNMR